MITLMRKLYRAPFATKKMPYIILPGPTYSGDWWVFYDIESHELSLFFNFNIIHFYGNLTCGIHKLSICKNSYMQVCSSILLYSINVFVAFIFPCLHIFAGLLG